MAQIHYEYIPVVQVQSGHTCQQQQQQQQGLGEIFNDGADTLLEVQGVFLLVLPRKILSMELVPANSEKMTKFTEDSKNPN